MILPAGQKEMSDEYLSAPVSLLPWFSAKSCYFVFGKDKRIKNVSTQNKQRYALALEKA